MEIASQTRPPVARDQRPCLTHPRSCRRVAARHRPCSGLRRVSNWRPADQHVHVASHRPARRRHPDDAIRPDTRAKQCERQQYVRQWLGPGVHSQIGGAGNFVTKQQLYVIARWHRRSWCARHMARHARVGAGSRQAERVANKGRGRAPRCTAQKTCIRMPKRRGVARKTPALASMFRGK